MDDEEDNNGADEALNLAALLNNRGSSFAALPGRAKESAGTFAYDNARYGIRAKSGRPLTDEAEAQYAQQSGALDQLTAQLRPSKADDSEKWLSVAAALLAPTETGKTSESIARALGAYGTVVGAQKKEERDTSLALAKLYQRYQSDMMRAQAAATKAAQPKPILLDSAGNPHEPMTGAVVTQPRPEAFAALEADPSDASLASFVEHFPRFASEAQAAVLRGRQRAGGQ